MARTGRRSRRAASLTALGAEPPSSRRVSGADEKPGRVAAPRLIHRRGKDYRKGDISISHLPGARVYVLATVWASWLPDSGNRERDVHMAARVHQFASRAQMLRREQAAELRQLVLGLEVEAPRLVAQLVAVIDRNTAADRGWSFVMLSPMQNRAVLRWINQHALRPRLSVALWAEFFCHMRTDTGEIVMDRKAMMEAAEASSSHVSHALAELVRIGALIRHREGRDVRWFMNPSIGTCLTGVAREKAQREAPTLLSVIEGGGAK